MKTSVERAAAIVEIQQLAARYSLGVDSRDMEAVASLYVDDVHAGRAGRGRDALQQRYEENDSQFGRSVSTVTNHVVDIVDDDHATGVVYLRMDQQIEDGSWATLVGAYFDQYERRGGQWYFAQRELVWWFRDEPLPPAGVTRTTDFRLPFGRAQTWGTLPERFESWHRFWEHIGTPPPGW